MEMHPAMTFMGELPYRGHGAFQGGRATMTCYLLKKLFCGTVMACGAHYVRTMPCDLRGACPYEQAALFRTSVM